MRNRLLALPRLRPIKTRRGEVLNSSMYAETRKKVEKYDAVSQFEEEGVEPINLKAFCKLFKSTSKLIKFVRIAIIISLSVVLIFFGTK